MNVDDMVVFAHVVEHESFSRAARALGVPTSTMSRRVRQLEADLGVRLLERNPRAVRPTAIGATYYERCAKIVREVEEANRVARAAHEVPRGNVRLTTPVAFGVAHLGEIASQYLRAYPDTTLELLLEDRAVDLVKEHVDLAVRIAGRLADSGLGARMIGRGGMKLVASPRYTAERGTPKRPDDLERHDCILLGDRPESAKWHLTTGRHQKTIAVRGRVRTNSLLLVRELALSGLGIGLLPGFLSTPLIAQGLLMRVLPRWSLRPVRLFAVAPSPGQSSAAVRALVELLSESLAERANNGT